MNYETLVVVRLRSHEREDDLPLQEVVLQKVVLLPIPPQVGLWLRDESETYNVVIDTVAIHAGAVVAYARPIEVAAKRVEQIGSAFSERKWSQSFL